MALRVLLADESATIKKVFQLALQDFGAEITTVALGTDVSAVAAKVKPDILFIDVLLQKRNGYEVSQEVKNNPDLKHIPIILIWSGFMELDEAKYKAAQANGHLEKPFETNQLRDLIKTHVPKTVTQPLSNYLSFPKLPEFEEKRAPIPAAPPAAPAATPPPRTKPREMTLDAGPAAPPPPPAEVDSFEVSVMQPLPDVSAKTGVTNPGKNETHATWSMENFEEIPSPIEHTESPDEFLAVELPATPTPPPPLPANKKAAAQEEDDNMWVQKTLADYKLKDEQLKEKSPTVLYKVPEEKIDPDTFVTNAMTGKKPQIPTPQAAKKATPPPPPPSAHMDEEELELDLSDDIDHKSTPTKAPQLSERQLEAVIRAQSQEIIEKVVWQVLPEIAARIIERELDRLLKERDKR